MRKLRLFSSNIMIAKTASLLVILCFLWQVVSALFNNYTIVFNNSDSLPQRVSVIQISKPYSKGDIVLFNNHSTSYLPDNMNFLKKVLGKSGDIVCCRDDRLFINNQYFGDLKVTTKSGKAVSPLGNMVIPDGFIFVFTSSVNSFDSRYVEFGLVSKDSIVGKAVWSW